jgi:hypothetical protein
MVACWPQWRPVKEKGGRPLILPAMGSHGGGTAHGQIEVLRHLGQTPETLGAPIHDRMEPVVVGKTEDCPVYADRAAIEADHIILVNRIKEHTEFIGEIESGLLKMAVVGLGRVAGAEVMHQLAVRISYVRAIQAITKVLFQKLPIRGGVAILEDKTNTLRRLEAVPAAACSRASRSCSGGCAAPRHPALRSTGRAAGDDRHVSAPASTPR